MNKCLVEGCNKPYVGRGMCRMHYMRWKRAGGTEPTVMLRKENGQGPTRSNFIKRKYVSTGNGTGLEYRIRIARLLDRPLKTNEIVHHWQGNPDTLVVCPSHGYHKLLHSREKYVALQALYKSNRP